MYLEVIYHRFAVEEVVQDGEEVPVERLAPGIPLFLVFHYWCFIFIPASEREEVCDFAIDLCLGSHDEKDHIWRAGK